MGAFRTKEELLEAINQGFNTLNQGTIDVNSMNDLVEATRELHERTLIIRYKAQELFVNEQPVSFEKDIEPVSNEFMVSSATLSPESLEDTLENLHNKEEIKLPEITQEIPTQNTFQPTFSVEEKEAGFAFDLFDIPSEREEIVEERMHEEVSAFEHTHFNEDFTPENEVSSEIENTSFEVEEQKQEEFSIAENTHLNEEFASEHEVISEIENASIAVEKDEVELPKTIAEIIQENPIAFGAELAEETNIQTSTPVTANDDTAFFNNYSSLKNNPSAMMTAPKIESLSSAFGLGEKLMYIRELFNGSSDSFNQAIAKIEQGSSFTDAKAILNNTAIDNNWSFENQATIDFVNKVERRFF
jgi:hypothetical protein